jgi:protein involved in polysaccharide export with SLBB domain
MKMKAIIAIMFPLSLATLRGGVKEGDSVQITVRGIPAGEQEKVNGAYRVAPTGIRLPFLKSRLPVAGLEPEQIAIAAEKAYQNEGVYQQPAIDVEIIRGANQKGQEASVSVGGQVKRSGAVPFREDMTLLQAIQGAGDRTEFGSRNIKLIRNGKTIPLDFRKAEHKNFSLQPNDSIIVEQRGVFEGGGD